MSKKNEQQYWDLVEQFIAQANNACEAVEPGIAAAALLQAATRFNAFVVASSSLDRKSFIEDIEPSFEYLSKRFCENLDDNLQDYKENYKIYMRTEADEQ